MSKIYKMTVELRQPAGQISTMDNVAEADRDRFLQGYSTGVAVRLNGSNGVRAVIPGDNVARVTFTEQSS